MLNHISFRFQNFVQMINYVSILYNDLYGKKVKVIPLHAMEAHEVRGGIAPTLS
jgi:hypothetical protein